jgi:SAM-dependent methyltransferase
MNFWDQNFAGAEYRYGTQPNAYLASQAHRLAPGSTVLVPGDGEGRNGVWLAHQGHRVTAIDLSTVGLDKARHLAQAQGVALDTQVADLSEWAPAPASADAVVFVFVHLPPGVREAAHRAAVQALRPGGLLILEAFTPAQLAFASGEPKAPELLYTLEQLRGDWGSALEELHAEETTTLLDEGPGHQGPGQVVHGVWRKRA